MQNTWATNDFDCKKIKTNERAYKKSASEFTLNNDHAALTKTPPPKKSNSSANDKEINDSNTDEAQECLEIDDAPLAGSKQSKTESKRSYQRFKLEMQDDEDEKGSIVTAQNDSKVAKLAHMAIDQI